MTDETKSGTSPTPSTASQASDVKWMLPPNMPAGVQVILTQVARTDQLTPEAANLLAKLMTEQLKPPPIGPGPVACDYLEHCTDYRAGSGPCPRLTSCGYYHDLQA